MHSAGSFFRREKALPRFCFSLREGVARHRA